MSDSLIKRSLRLTLFGLDKTVYALAMRESGDGERGRQLLGFGNRG